jgi:hypothetical protein
MAARAYYLLVALLILGLLVSSSGTLLWEEFQAGTLIVNYVPPASPIPAHSYVLTWGVGGLSSAEPDLWHFHVFFTANETGQVLLIWNLNQSILFERQGSNLNETFDMPLPRTLQSWRWDWMIRNTNDLVLKIENFTVAHYPVQFPNRQKGLILILVGASIVIVAITTIVYLRHTRPRV